VSLTAVGLNLHRDQGTTLVFELDVDDVDRWEILLLVCVSGPRYQIKISDLNRFRGFSFVAEIAGRRYYRHFANTYSRDSPVKSLCGTMTAYTTSKPAVRLSLNYHNAVHITAVRPMS
jgi:hypothetical protein